MKILVDMNLSPRWIEYFRHQGVDAIHWSSIGKIDALDLEIMAFAAAHDYIVLTHDLDFGAILASTHRAKPSVVQIRADDLSISAIGTQILSALRQLEFELMEGALVTVDTK